MSRFRFFDDVDPIVVTQPHHARRFDGETLCTGCKHAHLYRRRATLEPFVYCHELGRHMPQDIVECSQFEPVAALSLHQMQQIALSVDPRRGISDGSYR